jgi:quercetin dioxygenase-like cupin family protein
MHSRLSRPFRPIDVESETLEFFQLSSLAEDLKRESEYAEHGVCSIAIARDEHVTLVLVAVRRAEVLGEHHFPSAGTLVVLSGRVAFSAEEAGRYEELGAGALAVFSADLCHGVEALEDSTYLVIIGGRERPATAPGTDQHAREPSA